MNKLKKILIIAIPLLLTGCILFQKNNAKSTEKVEKDIIEVSKKPVINKINIKSATFASDIIMDRLAESSACYQTTKINNLSQIESLDFDIAIVPAYQVVDLYNKTDGNINLAAITLVNNLYIISDKQINSPKDMAGKTIMVPELNDSLNKLIDLRLGFLKKLMKINTEVYYSQKDLLKTLNKAENIIAILTEPYYTKAIGDKSYYSFDINKAISMMPNSKTDSSADFLSDVIIVNKNYMRDNKDSLDKFLDEYKKGQKLVDQNSVLSQNIMNYYDMTNEEAIKIYNSMDHRFIESDTMVGVFEIYLDKLENLDKNIFNGNRPSEDLYYKNKN